MQLSTGKKYGNKSDQHLCARVARGTEPTFWGFFLFSGGMSFWQNMTCKAGQNAHLLLGANWVYCLKVTKSLFAVAVGWHSQLV